MSDVVNDSKIAILVDGIVRLVLDTDSEMYSLLLGGSELIGINDQPNKNDINFLSVYDRDTNSFTVYETDRFIGQQEPTV